MTQKSDFHCYQVMGIGVINATPMVKITGPPELLEAIADILEELGEDPTEEEIEAALEKRKE